MSAERRPEPDGTITALDPQARAEIASLLGKRARGELGVAATFAAIARELIETGADPSVIRLATRALDDEVRHVALWCDLAGRYAGHEVPWPEAPRRGVPPHTSAPPDLVPLLHVSGMCCINETIAITRLEAGLASAKGSAMQSALRTILKDEVDHARLGWAHLASAKVNGAQREALALWLPRLLASNLDAMMADVESALEPGYPEHGFISGSETHHCIERALRELVIPGFEHVGVDTSAAAEVLESRIGARSRSR